MEKARKEIAGMAPLLEKAAEGGDKKAQNLFQEAAREHSLTVKALIKRLNFNKENQLLISYSGGVFKAGTYILKPFRNFIKQNQNRDRKIKLTAPILKPVTGAALWAAVLYAKKNNSSKINKDLMVENLKKEEKGG